MCRLGRWVWRSIHYFVRRSNIRCQEFRLRSASVSAGREGLISRKTRLTALSFRVRYSHLLTTCGLKYKLPQCVWMPHCTQSRLDSSAEYKQRQCVKGWINISGHNHKAQLRGWHLVSLFKGQAALQGDLDPEQQTRFLALSTYEQLAFNSHRTQV
jgi:hypothetical protein